MGSFENDDARDWVAGLEEGDGLATTRAALRAVVEQERPPHAPAASVTMAAAEVVAALGGAPAKRLPGGIRRLVDDGVARTDEDRDLALQALERVADPKCELAALWRDAGKEEGWREGLEDLRARVAGTD